MGRQRADILHRDLSKEREGKGGKEQEQRSEQQIFEGRRGERAKTRIGISQKRQRGREEQQEQRSEQQVSEDRRGDRERRTYIGISSKREREEKKRARAEI